MNTQYLWWLIFVLLPTTMVAQEVITQPGLLRMERRHFYEGDREMTKVDFWQKVRSQPEAAKILLATKQKAVVAIATGSAGTLIMLLSDPIEYNFDWNTTSLNRKSGGGGKVIGGTLVLLGGIVALTTIDGRSKAVEAYNRALFSTATLRLSPTAEGLGISWYF